MLSLTITAVSDESDGSDIKHDVAEGTLVNVKEAIYQVLKQSNEPLRYTEITKRAIAQGLYVTEGLTPEATVNAQLSAHIKRHGAASRFRRIKPGFYELNESRNEPDNQNCLEPVTPPTNMPLSFAEAAERVLEQSENRQPMHYRDITSRAIHLGLISPHGKTPERTMYTQIYSEIERQIRRGERPRFAKVGRGMFGLSRWMSTGLAFQIAEHNRRVRNELLDQVQKMDPFEFEALAGEVLTALGFDTSVTKPIGDGGVDVRGTLVVGDVIRTRMAVQVKRHRQNIQSPVIQQMRGSLGAHEQGLIITTSDFSAGARAEAERPDATPIALMNGEQFVKLMIEHDIGVRRESHFIIELGEQEVAE
jgi:restriction system protein